MYDLKPLADFLLSVADLPANAATTARLKTRTRPLPNWSILYGRVAQVTDRNGVFLWKYEEPEMLANPTLVCLRNYPQERALVDGKLVIVFAKNEGPYILHRFTAREVHRPILRLRQACHQAASGPVPSKKASSGDSPSARSSMASHQRRAGKPRTLKSSRAGLRTLRRIPCRRSLQA